MRRIEKTESLGDIIIYWLVDETDKRIGIAFRPHAASIANQGTAESIALLLDMGDDLLSKDDELTKLRTDNAQLHTANDRLQSLIAEYICDTRSLLKMIQENAENA